MYMMQVSHRMLTMRPWQLSCAQLPHGGRQVPTESSADHTHISHSRLLKDGCTHPLAAHRTCISRMRLLQVS